MSAERVIKSSLLRPRCPFTRTSYAHVCLFGNDRCERSSSEGTSFVKRRVERRIVTPFWQRCETKKKKRKKRIANEDRCVVMTAHARCNVVSCNRSERWIDTTHRRDVSSFEQNDGQRIDNFVQFWSILFTRGGYLPRYFSLIRIPSSIFSPAIYISHRSIVEWFAMDLRTDSILRRVRNISLRYLTIVTVCKVYTRLGKKKQLFNVSFYKST